jgi:hypothetical protein
MWRNLRSDGLVYGLQSTLASDFMTTDLGRRRFLQKGTADIALFMLAGCGVSSPSKPSDTPSPAATRVAAVSETATAGAGKNVIGNVDPQFAETVVRTYKSTGVINVNYLDGSYIYATFALVNLPGLGVWAVTAGHAVATTPTRTYQQSKSMTLDIPLAGISHEFAVGEYNVATDHPPRGTMGLEPDPAQDIALIHFPYASTQEFQVPHLMIATENPQVGDELLVMGYPKQVQSKSLYIQQVEVEVAAPDGTIIATRDYDDVGGSGSPAINRQGELAGVWIQYQGAMEGIFAPASSIQALYEKLK